MPILKLLKWSSIAFNHIPWDVYCTADVVMADNIYLYIYRARLRRQLAISHLTSQIANRSHWIHEYFRYQIEMPFLRMACAKDRRGLSREECEISVGSYDYTHSIALHCIDATMANVSFGEQQTSHGIVVIFFDFTTRNIFKPLKIVGILVYFASVKQKIDLNKKWQFFLFFFSLGGIQIAVYKIEKKRLSSDTRIAFKACTSRNSLVSFFCVHICVNWYSNKDDLLMLSRSIKL